ncbi:transcription factor S-II, central domain-containing protein, partial [Tirmania nivea]
EPRRSGRKTKGQHTRNSDVHELPPPTPAKTTPSRRKSTAPKQPTPVASEEDDANAQIRCACGATQEVKGDTRMMVQCEGCKVWQHCECLELDEDELEEDKDYYCEVCKPENHEEFLAKVERGEKPWETARRTKRKRKGRKSTGKGKKGKASQAKKKGGKKVEPKPELEPEPEPEPEVEKAQTEEETKKEAEAQAEAQVNAGVEAGEKPDTEMEEEPKPQAAETGEPISQPVEEETTRKEAEPGDQGVEEDTKEGVGVGEQDITEKTNGNVAEIDKANRDVEKPEQEAPPEAVEKVDDLRNNARRNIVKFLAPIIEKIVQQNESILSEDQRKEQYPEKLALEIEYHLYLALWNQHSQPTQQYKLKARGIGLNLPKNPVLQSRLLKGEVTPESLVQMKPEEMASEEFQLMAEQVRRESEIQNTILTEETGPRIRRTHKGEEIVEDDVNRPMVNDEPFYSGGGGATDHVMEEAPSPRSRAVSQTAEEFPHSPPQLKTEESTHSAHIESAPQTPRTPLSARTPITARGRQFSIEGVWNNVNTPEGPTHPKTPGTRQTPHMLSLRTTAQPKSVVDAEIDKLLAEEDHEMENETPPYSPSELTFTDSALPVWRGRVSMISVSNFRARAHLLGGPEDAQHKLPLNDLLGGTMLIDGRIGIDRATEYLCGQKFSQTNEIIVLAIEPEDHIEPAAATEFNKLFQYFQKKERYGVVGKPLHKYIKDCYLVPIDVRDDMPDFFECLAKHSLEQTPRKKRVFAVVFVLKVPQHHSHHQQQQQHYPAAQPLPAYPPQAHPNYQHPYPQPYGQQQHPYVTPPSINHHPHGNGYHHPYYQPQSQQQPLPIHNQHQSPPLPPPQQLQQSPSQPQQQNQLAQQQPVKKFHFIPWKELQDALPQLTFEQVNIINNIVARNPAAQQDPGLLAKLIKEHGGM